MTARHYVDSAGNYLGGFQGAEPPAGSIEVPSAPTHAKDKWDGTAWNEIPRIKTQKTSDCKQEALRRILLIVPGATSANFVTKEMNLLMQAASLIDKKAHGITLTADEMNTLTSYRDIKSRIDAVRSASDLIESDIAVSTNPAGFDIVNSPRWPA